MEINHDLNSTKNKNTLTIVLVVILLIALTFGGYFAYKYYSQKSETTAETSTSPSARNATIRDIADLINLLRYPQAETLSNGTKVSSSQIDDFNMQTIDSVATVYNYYMGLLSEYYWGIGPSEINSDQTSAFISIKEDDFQADINISTDDEDMTQINIDIKTGTFAQSNDHTYTTVKSSASPSPSPTSVSNTDSSKKITITTDYVISDSNTRVIEVSELEDLSPWELKVARNEIYARHGREFDYQDMKCYFENKSWYSVNPNFSESDLSSTEIKNISIILEREKEIDSQLMSKDLGC